jgi:tRNA(Ile)-lysidine synthase
VLAHHADDLFETRLIRLIRGTGAQGLASMQFCSPDILRPFLGESKNAILQYAQEAGLEWCEDPSNLDLGPLRNWLRYFWLKELEKKRSGGGGAFQRSLQLLVDEIGLDGDREIPIPEVTNGANGEILFAIDLRRYRKLSLPEQGRDLAGRLFASGVRDFSMGQIQEILKRIMPPLSAGTSRRPARSRSFRVLNLTWKFNAEQILVSNA